MRWRLSGQRRYRRGLDADRQGNGGGDANAISIVDVLNTIVGSSSDWVTSAARELQAANQFVMSGNIYKMGYYGNKYVTPAAVAEAKAAQAAVATTGKVITYGSAALGVVIAGAEVAHGGGSDRSLAEGAVGLATTASAFIPVVGPGVAVGLAVVNAAGGFNWLYNDFSDKPRFQPLF